MDARQQKKEDLIRIKKALKQSYEPEKHSGRIEGWMIDRHLSGKRAQVYADPTKKKVLIVHRGSQGSNDWLQTDPKLAVGQLGSTKRGKYGVDITKKAVAKYGDDAHITVAGHSLGGSIAHLAGQKVKGVDEVVSVNPGHSLIGKRRVLPNEVEYRHRFDPISNISGGLFNQHDRLKINRKPSWNPHSVDAAIPL